MLILSRNIVGVLVSVVAVISAQIQDSGGRTNVINNAEARNSDDDVFYEADVTMQARDKRTIGTLLSGVADLFGYDVQRRPSLLPLESAPAAPPAAVPASSALAAELALVPADPALPVNADGDALLARQLAPPAAPPAGPAPAAPAPGPGPLAPGPAGLPTTLTNGVRRAFQLGWNWSNQRQLIGGAPPGPAPAAPPPAAPAPPPAAAPPPPPGPAPLQGERRSYTVGLNWQNLRQQLGPPPPGPAPAGPPPAGGAPPPAAAAPPPNPQGFRQSYQVGFDFSNQRQQLGGPPPAPAPPAAAPPPPAAAPPPPAAPAAGAPIANLGTGPRRVPELLRQNPLTPSLVERIYFKNDGQLPVKKVFYPKELPLPLGNNKLTDKQIVNRPPIRLDTPPGEKNEPSFREKNRDREDSKEDSEEIDDRPPIRVSAERTKSSLRPDRREPEEENESDYSDEREDDEVERKPAPRGFEKAPPNTEWKKQQTGDPNEEVYVLEEDYTYGDKPKRYKIEFPDYSEDAVDQKRDILKGTPKPRKFKKFRSFPSDAPEYLSPTPLTLVQLITEDFPKENKNFDSEFDHHRSVRSLNSPTTNLQQDTLPSPTLTRAYLVHHDSEPAENIEAARILNRKIINYYGKKFLNDAIAAQRAIQNPHLINEPNYKIDSDKYIAPDSVSFKQEGGQNQAPAAEKEKVQEVTNATPVQKVESFETQVNDHGKVHRHHQNILRDLVNNFENQQRFPNNKYPSAQGVDKAQEVKTYYSKALDGIVKNFEKTAKHELLGDKILANKHKEMLEAIKQTARQNEQAQQEVEAIEKEAEGKDKAVEEHEPVREQVEEKRPNNFLKEEESPENDEEITEDDENVKVGNEDIVGLNEEFENVNEERNAVKQEQEAKEPETQKDEDKYDFDFTYFKPNDFVKKLEKVAQEEAVKEKPENNLEKEEESPENDEEEIEHDGKVKVGNEDVVGPNDKFENVREEEKQEEDAETPEIKKNKEDKYDFDYTYFFKPNDFVKNPEKVPQEEAVNENNSEKKEASPENDEEKTEHEGSPENNEETTEDDGKVTVGNEDIVGTNQDIENVQEEKKQEMKQEQETEPPQIEKEKEDKKEFDFAYFFKPSDFVKELEKVIYPENLDQEYDNKPPKEQSEGENDKIVEPPAKENQKDVDIEYEHEEIIQKGQPGEKQDRSEEAKQNVESDNLEGKEKESDKNEESESNNEDDEESEAEEESDETEQSKANSKKDDETEKETEEESEEDEEQRAEEKKKADEEAAKLRKEEEKRRQLEENEKELKAYIDDHFEVDVIDGVSVPRGVKDTDRYKKIVEEVRRPIEDNFDFFNANEFEFKEIDGFFGHNFDDNLKRLEKSGNRVEEKDTNEEEEEEESDEEAEEEEESENDGAKPEETEDKPSPAQENKEKTSDESKEEEDEADEESEENSEDEEKEEEAESKPQPKEDQAQSKQQETLRYPHEEKSKEIYSQFREKLENPETQDSNTHEVVHPHLHTGGFKSGGVEAFDNPDKVLSVPIDYDYSSSEKKLVVETSPAKEDTLLKHVVKTSSVKEDTQIRVRRQVGDFRWSYKPERYDPNFESNVVPEPKVLDLSKIETKTYKDDEPLSPTAIVTESENGRKRTYIRVKQRQQDMYG